MFPKILVSKETVVLRRWEIETEIYFIKRVDKGQIATVKDLEIFHGGYLTFINSFDKINS